MAGAVTGSAVLSLAALKLVGQEPPARDFNKEARDSHQENSLVLASFRIPMSLEPAFQFKA